MARLLVAATLLALTSTTARAEDYEPELVLLAAEAGVDPGELAGALNSQPGVDGRTYLEAVGELEPPVPPIVGAVWRADCIIGKESGGLDVPNRQGSGAWGPGQYFPGTWASHTDLYRRGTRYAGPLSLHSLPDVRRVMAWILSTYPHMRSAWTVGGC